MCCRPAMVVSSSMRRMVVGNGSVSTSSNEDCRGEKEEEEPEKQASAGADGAALAGEAKAGAEAAGVVRPKDRGEGVRGMLERSFPLSFSPLRQSKTSEASAISSSSSFPKKLGSATTTDALSLLVLPLANDSSERSWLYRDRRARGRGDAGED